MRSPSLFAFALYFSRHLAGVDGQGTNAVCNTGYEWMNNSLGQSPCLVASYLFTPCPSEATTWVFPLSPGYQYRTPIDDPSSATPCRCNTVLYSMISACATCQGQGLFVPAWSTYAWNCSTTYIQQYPKDIPSGTAVPAWAYLDVRKFDDFNAVAAQAAAKQDLPESTALSSAPTATALTAPPSASESGSAVGAPSGKNGTSSDNTSSSKKSNNIAPIVGGVVGGVVGAIAIGLALFFCVRRKRDDVHNAPTGPVDLLSGEYGRYTDNANEFDGGTSPVVTQYDPAIRPSLARPPSSKVYDPNDPSTFPESTNDTQPRSSRESTGRVSPAPSYHTAVPYTYPAASPYQPSAGASSAAYKGVPES